MNILIKKYLKSAALAFKTVSSLNIYICDLLTMRSIKAYRVVDCRRPKTNSCLDSSSFPSHSKLKHLSTNDKYH